MIDGLKLDISADELVKLIDERITEHNENAQADDENARRLDGTRRANEADEWDDGDQGMRLRHRAQAERDRAGALTFMRNHVVRGETYRLSEDDLKTLEILRRNVW
jgi:hypothetical protein